MKNLRLFSVLTVALVIVMSQGGSAHAEPLGTAFTYTGVLFENDAPADGQYDFSFGLFDMNENGMQLGNDVNVPDVNVTGGFFAVLLDFGGDVFNGDARWLEIGIRPTAPEALDQEQIDSDVTFGWIELLQSFTPETSGFLTKVEIYSSSPQTGQSSPGTLEIYEGESKYTALLATESVTWTEGMAWKTFTFSRPAFLASGSKYSLRITAPDFEQSFLRMNWSDSTYLGGRAFAYGVAFDPNDDLAFKTYMVSDQGEYTPLSPRREITATPYSLYSLRTHGILVNDTNTFVGLEAGQNNTGIYNTFSGYQAGFSNTTGNYNTFSGSYSGFSNTTGSDNTFLGDSSGSLNTTGSENTFSGVGAGLSNTTGNQNTFSGSYSGYSNTEGNYNTFSGYSAGLDNTIGNYNTFSGANAGYSNTEGWFNTFSGYQAGLSNTTGNNNTFSGANAGHLNTEGSNNTFSGYEAGFPNTTGSNNTFSGYQAGRSNTEGWFNTFSGYQAGFFNTTGSSNTFSGYQSGRSNTTGNYNTFLGHSSGYSNTVGNNNVFIGYEAGYFETGSNKLYIANSRDDEDVLIYGDFSSGSVGIGTMSPGYKLSIMNGNMEVQNTAGADNSGPYIKFRETNFTDVAGIFFKADGHDNNNQLRFTIGAGNEEPPAQTQAMVIQQDGNVGIGTTDPAAKLDINGKIKITDGTQAAGRVLTSDAVGLASWQSLAFGSRSSRVNKMTYMAVTDGFVVGNTSGLDDGESCHILSDSSSPPSTVVTHIFSAGSISGGNQYPFCIPVKKGDYWKVVDNGSHGSPRIWWIPVGG